MNRLFIFILFAVSCHSRRYNHCQDINTPRKARSGCCGVHLGSDNLEASGDAANNQFPWLAILENEDGAISYTGALITSKHVFTTAQVDIFVIENVRLGVFYRNQTDNDTAVTIAASSMMSEFDIALVLLAKKAPYNEFIRPICLPTSDVLVAPPDSLRFINAGWSRRTSNYENVIVKHYVTLPHIDRRTCQRRNSYSGVQISDNIVCAGVDDPSYQSITCTHNGGSPLMLKENGRYTLVGITTFGSYRCGVKNVPDVFTKIYPYLQWINRNVDELLENELHPFGIYK